MSKIADVKRVQMPETMIKVQMEGRTIKYDIKLNIEKVIRRLSDKIDDMRVQMLETMTRLQM